MPRVPDLISDALAREVESRQEWDEPPALYSVYVAGSEVRLRDVGFPPSVWTRGRPPAVLTSIAAMAEEYQPVLRKLASPGLYGVAFRCEQYRVALKPGTEEARRAQQQARAHTLHTRADRIEERGIWAVDRAGITYAAVKERVSGETHRITDYPHPGRVQAAGTVPAALDRLIAAYLNVAMPARPDADEEVI